MIELEDEGHVIGCGWYDTDLSAGFFRIGNDGRYQFYYRVAVDTATSAVNRCYGISYDKINNLMALLIQSNSNYLSYSGNKDNSIILMDSSGIMKNGRIVSFKVDVTYDTVYHNNFLVYSEPYYFYGGQTTGF